MLKIPSVGKASRPSPARRDAAAQDLAREVLGYFLRNPHASDGLEGIVKWRLAEENVHRTVQATRCALELLVDKGYVLERCSAVAGKSFALNGRKRLEAECFAQGEKSGWIGKNSK